MRLALIALIPMALAACGGQSVDPDDRMPAPTAESENPEGSASSGNSEQTNYAIASIDASDAAMEGSWETTSIGGNDAVRFIDADENPQLAVICTDRGDDAMNSVTVRRFVDEEAAGESISIYMSSGNKSYEVNGTPIDLTVAADDSFAIILGQAAGDMRFITGDNEVVIPASTDVGTLVKECRGEVVIPEEEPEEDAEAEEDEGDEE